MGTLLSNRHQFMDMDRNTGSQCFKVVATFQCRDQPAIAELSGDRAQLECDPGVIILT